MTEPCRILRIADWFTWSCAEIEYPHKIEIAVFQCGSDEVLGCVPHAHDDLVSVACFEPTDRGWAWANEFCMARRKEET